MKAKLPTVDELNSIQAEWMKLDCEAPQPEKDRVFKLMERIPSCYVSAAGGLGVVNYGGGPLNRPVALQDALTLCAGHGGRTDVVWSCNKWLPVPEGATIKRADPSVPHPSTVSNPCTLPR